MKPNLEISLKFWIAYALFFVLTLSIPFSDYLFKIGKFINNYELIFCIIIIVFLIIPLVIYVTFYNELKSKLNKETFFKDVSMQTIEDYETQIKDQEDHIKELKKSFEDAVVEITELRSKIKKNRDDNNELITYWKERALHQKHTKKKVESEWWECLTWEYDNFSKGSIYKQDKSLQSKDNLIWLFENENHLHPYLVEKINFKPVTNGN